MTEPQPNLKNDHVYAIIRIDQFHHQVAYPENTIMIVKVVYSREFAEAEVARLNTLNGAKGSRYFWQITRIERDSSSAP